ncbi:hypothetical protein B4U80_06589 [Leptotrombidium deliense]|uniref:Uncharacterized protein n=1 Tax=Leptotrombidium deliense TaxID=299467 RepID=A0A443S175_9ACAR|nr:hypothetical protein B4U80_06589 [Leptotrombidium deliense]
MYPGNYKHFLEAYNDATEKDFGYLVIDIKPGTPSKYRLRTRITLDEHTPFSPIIYFPKYKSLRDKLSKDLIQNDELLDALVEICLNVENKKVKLCPNLKKKIGSQQEKSCFTTGRELLVIFNSYDRAATFYVYKKITFIFDNHYGIYKENGGRAV